MYTNLLINRKLKMQVLVQDYKSIEAYLNSIGKIGSSERLKAISMMNLGERSEAAKRVLVKREIKKIS